MDIDRSGGAIGFVDDFNAWVTGSSTRQNMAAIQHRILPRVEAWARESGAIFEAEKTGLVHFTSRAIAMAIARSGQAAAEGPPLNFQGTEIHP